jgi:hypothetical protein
MKLARHLRTSTILGVPTGPSILGDVALCRPFMHAGRRFSESDLPIHALDVLSAQLGDSRRPRFFAPGHWDGLETTGLVSGDGLCVVGRVPRVTGQPGRGSGGERVPSFLATVRVVCWNFYLLIFMYFFMEHGSVQIISLFRFFEQSRFSNKFRCCDRLNPVSTRNTCSTYYTFNK